MGWSDGKDSDTRVITMAEENRGAFMEVIQSDKNNNTRHHHQIRQNKDTLNEEDTTNNKNPKIKSMGTRSVMPMKAFFNSNVQGINNSIMMDSNSIMMNSKFTQIQNLQTT